MTLPLPVLQRMRDDGCTAAQIVGVIEAEHAYRAEQRAQRRARALLRASEPDIGRVGSATKMNEPDTIVRLKPDMASETDPEPDTGSLANMAGMARPPVKAIARNAIGLVAGLSPSAVRVAHVLIDCCNLDTGRCDPGNASIANRLNIDVRTVRRATRQLHAAGLILSKRHGGHRHCNAFTPQWDRFSAIVGADGWAREPDTAGLSRAGLSSEPDNVVRQNLIKNPDSNSVLVAPAVRTAKRLKRPDRAQPQFLLPIPNTRAAPSSADVAEDAAHKRLHAHFQRRLGEREGSVLLVSLDEVRAGLYAEALSAEIHRSGGGIGMIEQAFRDHTGPPVAVAAR